MFLPVPQAPQEATPSQLVVNAGTSRRVKASPATIAGGVLLAVAGGLVVAVAPVQASRVRLRDEANELRGMVDVAGGATPEQRRRAEVLDQAAGRTHIATMSLSLSAAAAAALGVVLVVVGVRKPGRLEVMPQGVGLLLQGRFRALGQVDTSSRVPIKCKRARAWRSHPSAVSSGQQLNRGGPRRNPSAS